MATLPYADYLDDRSIIRPEPARVGEGEPSRLRLTGFASIAVPIAGAGLPLALFVPQLYATQFGLSLATIGFIFLLGRIWDVSADPLVGALSDRTRSRFGRRRPWIAAGGLLFGLSSALLFFPPAALVTPAYLGAALFFFYLGWSMIEIPASAWAGELSRHYHGRTRVVSYQALLRAIGLLAVLVLPTILDQVEPGNGTLKLQLVGGFIIATLIPSLALTLFSVPEPPVPATPPVRQSFWRATSVIFSDRLLLRVLASDAVVTAGQSIRASLIVFFAVWYMGLPAWASGLYLLQFIFGVAAAPIWLRIGTRIGKRQAAISGEIAQAAINIGLLFVFPGGLPLLLALTIAQGLTQGSGNLMLRAMVADVADAHRLRTGHDRTGLFFSVFALSAKLGPAIGIGIALPLIAWLGFAAGPHNDATALEGLKTVFALGPALAHIIATLIIWRFPLDEAAHAEIRRALDQRDAIPA
ncbi:MULTISPECIES: MFS transporter [Sphingobium]|jgi:Na+/melibiose symporter-like transporter|uniref:Sodium:melibiose symporter n=1 Tax=Sphingobium yanoikuyae TaxID=13690 RepID=A0A2D1QX40_SPHYA|nr:MULTISPECIES: MFS transporter [Sphingobium]ATP17135.1 sodium:melibiose symporter [Sphingobium yanoikuyae]QHD69860.1 sodium:melibiose symporter [Sphingobium yanoikuyae]TKV42860.1 sodium:melibiose symporter [Sphingobium sp. MP9-4]